MFLRSAALEVQVSDEGDFPERSLYYWAREYSSALGEGEEYINLPRTIIISIVGFKMFDCVEFHSEFHALEVTRHTRLTDKFVMHYFELPKVPKTLTKDDELKLWLSLFNAKTEEELKQIEALEVSVMSQVIKAYRNVTADEKFKELERQRKYASHNKASALGHARREGIKIGSAAEREKWQGVVADKDVALADKDAQIAKLLAQLAETKQI